MNNTEMICTECMHHGPNKGMGHSGSCRYDQPLPKTVDFESGATSTKQPRLDLIPYQSLCRLADRFELGVERHGEKAWNARSANQACLTDREFVIARAAHCALHAMRLIAILEGTLEEDGDDHAAAIAWSGMLLCRVDLQSMKKAIT